MHDFRQIGNHLGNRGHWDRPHQRDERGTTNLLTAERLVPAAGQGPGFEELAEDCAQDGRYAFLCSAPPIGSCRAVGSPLNPPAIT